MKEQTMTSIDVDLKKRAKQGQINISALLEDSIRHSLNTTKVEFDEPSKCWFCSKPGVRAKAINKGKNVDDGLCWLYPHEKWICNSCLRDKASKIPIAVS